MTWIRRPYTASGEWKETYPEEGRAGRDRGRMAAATVGGRAQAPAIGAGPTGTGMWRMFSRPMRRDTEQQRRDRQRREAAVIATTMRGQDRGRANAHGRAQRIADAALMIRTSVNGRPMTGTRERANLPGKEKDRCANTGPFLSKSLVVTVGIRSDRRQTA